VRAADKRRTLRGLRIAKHKTEFETYIAFWLPALFVVVQRVDAGRNTGAGVVRSTR
jgi:hypothetical protein